MTTLQKILSRASRAESGCLLLPDQKHHRYPEVYVGELRRRMNGHRAMWTVVNGDIPAGMCVLHRCDVPRCVEPSHLYLGTMADNMHDRDAKGRNGTIGERARHAKLNADKVKQIRLRLQYGHRPTRIARDYGVTLSAIIAIRDGETWKHVS